MTIPALARENGVPRRTLSRQLLAAHRRDLSDPARDATWLYRNGPDAVWCVNLPRLRAAHPEFFGVPSPAELHEQIKALAEQGRLTRQQVQALAGAFRGHRQRHEEIDRVLGQLRQALLGRGSPSPA